MHENLAKAVAGRCLRKRFETVELLEKAGLRLVGYVCNGSSDLRQFALTPVPSERRDNSLADLLLGERIVLGIFCYLLPVRRKVQGSIGTIAYVRRYLKNY